jgi:hypothetical protein
MSLVEMVPPEDILNPWCTDELDTDEGSFACDLQLNHEGLHLFEDAAPDGRKFTVRWE